MGAWYDLQDAYEDAIIGKYSIAGMFVLRAAAQLGAAALSITVGLAFAKPYLEYLLKKYGARPIFGAALRSGLHTSTALALRMVSMLRFLFALNIVILALVLVEIFLLPDQLQRYLACCTFRKDRNNASIDTEEKEIKSMQDALRGTL